MPIISEVIVIGGGAVGAACARELARSGRRVLVLERGTDEGASWRAAAGMLAPQIEASAGDPGYDLALAGRERYSKLAPELRENCGIDVEFWRGGIARIATDESEVATLKSRIAWQTGQGQPAEWLDPGEVKARWPWTGPSHGALWAPREAALHPVRLVEALLGDAIRAGAELRRESAREIELQRDGTVKVVGQETYFSRHLVLAAGAWSPQISGVPRPLPVVPVRGQMACFPWPQGVERAIVYGKHAYVVARDNEAIAGSTMEHAGFVSAVTPEGLAHVVSSAHSLCPPLSRLEVTRTWAGLRPVTPDGLPILGREPHATGLWYATGHGRNGILLAAITGRIITQLINEESPELDPSPFRPERFFEWP